MIIDANTHISDSGKWFDSGREATLASLLDNMTKNKIGKSLLLPLPGIVSNDLVAKAEIDFPNQIIAGSYFDPGSCSDEAAAISEFEKGIVNRKKRIVKFHNRLSGIDADDSRFLKVLEYNNSLQVPVPVAICSVFNDKTTEKAIVPPAYVFDLAQKLCSTKLLILHGTGSWLLKTAEIIRSLPNVYLDLSFTISRFKGSSLDVDIKWLCENFDRRVIWGSDSPEIDQGKALNDFLEISGGIESSKLDRILGENINEILMEG